jgi:hypothetical protein
MSARLDDYKARTVEHMTRSADEALKIMRAARTNAHFRIHVAIDAPLPDTDNMYIPGGFRAGVQVSRGAAEAFVSDAFTARLTERGAALKISVYTGDRRTRWKRDGSAEREEYGAPRVTVWIG